MRTVGAARHGVYYGWVLVGALSFTEMISYGVLSYAFGVFLLPIQSELGWSRVALTGAYSLALLLSGVAAVPFGRWLDRRGPRLLMTAGSCAATVLVLSWAEVRSLQAFYLLWAGLGVAMAAVLYEPAFVVVATWFERRRGQALTLLTFVGGLASVVFIPLTDWLIRAYGWRPALVVLAGILGVGTIPIHALVLRRHPHDLGLAPDGGGSAAAEQPALTPEGIGVRVEVAVRQVAFWWLTCSFSLATLAAVAITVHLVPYLVGRGFSPSFTAAAAGLIGTMALPGRLIFTPLGSRLPRHVVTALLFLLQTVAFLVLLGAHSSGGVLLFVVLFGAGYGAITPARAALIADIYGPAEYGSISSILGLFVTGARALAPVGAGALFTLSGSYAPVLWSLAVCSALAMIAVLLIRE